MHRGRGAEAGTPPWGGLALGSFAVILLGLSVLMPKLHSETIRLQHNRLIDGWEGSALICCALLVLLGAGLGMRRRGWGWLTCAAGVATLAVVIYASTGSRLVVQLAGIAGEAPIRGTVGFGLLLAGLGAVMAIGAGLMIVRARDIPA